MTEKQSNVTRFSWIDGLVLAASVCAIVSAILGANALLRAATPMIPSVEDYDGSFPLGVELLFRTSFPLLMMIPGGILLLIGLVLRVTRRRRMGRVLMVAGLMAPLALLGLLAGGLSALEDISRQMSGAEDFPPEGIETCACKGAFQFVGDCECGCDKKGRVVTQIVDNGGDHIFDAKLVFEYDQVGALVAFTVDEGMEGRVDKRCRYDPPCSDLQGHACRPVCRESKYCRNPVTLKPFPEKQGQ